MSFDDALKQYAMFGECDHKFTTEAKVKGVTITQCEVCNKTIDKKRMPNG